MSPADPCWRSPKAARCRRPYLSLQCISDTLCLFPLSQERVQGWVHEPSNATAAAGPAPAAAWVSLPLHWHQLAGLLHRQGQGLFLLAGVQGLAAMLGRGISLFSGTHWVPNAGTHQPNPPHPSPARSKGGYPVFQLDRLGLTSKGVAAGMEVLLHSLPEPGPFTAPVSQNRNNPKHVSIIQGFN